MNSLILFGTEGCHLCEEAEQLVAVHKHLHIKMIDIAEETEWQERYAVKIPVLLDSTSGAELCWPFDASDLRNFLQTCGGTASASSH